MTRPEHSQMAGEALTGPITVLFLHGVGGRSRRRSWLRGIDQGMAEMGLPALSKLAGVRIIDPSYGRVLDGVGVDTRLALPRRQSQGHTASERLDYEARVRSARARMRPYRLLETRRPRPGISTVGPPWSTFVTSASSSRPARVLPMPRAVRRAFRYETDQSTRRQVARIALDRMGRLPAGSNVIIIGHSLGSLAAWDLLSRLPIGIRVPLLLTIGSPIGKGWFPRATRFPDRAAFPYARVRLWANVYDPDDAVASAARFRDGSRRRPALDLRVQTGSSADALGRLGYAEHDAGAYLRTPLCAALLQQAQTV